ncbi:YbaK/EbsC family protein [Halomicrobium salinisoli]|uniref:YbaK/EbsC family protein n=1 Tax=Halomicrobium salinisoli TaxID=2878391 RepID=UPI001CF05AEF|nr:YbaK/EbsC family protein [Halomicrobium salinisoli]
MHPRAEEFRERASDEYGFEPSVREFDEGTETAADAAAAVGCDVAQIVKSIVLRVGDRTVLALTSGEHRVDEAELAAAFDAEPGAVRTADPDEVTAATGWSIGGVPPFCHEEDLPVLADPAVRSFDELWAAAGTPEAVFPLTPARLEEFTDPEYVDVYK